MAAQIVDFVSINFSFIAPVPSFFVVGGSPFCWLSRKNLYGKEMDEEVAGALNLSPTEQRELQ